MTGLRLTSGRSRCRWPRRETPGKTARLLEVVSGDSTLRYSMETFRIMWRGFVLAAALLLDVPGFAVAPDFKAVARASGEVYGCTLDQH